MFQARFIRRKKRTPEDVFRNVIQPKIGMGLQQGAQEIVHFARTNHSYENRTGALEDSVQWNPPERKGERWFVRIHAGGWGKAQFDVDVAHLRATGKKRFNYRYQRGMRFRVRRGMGVRAYYAVFVEAKGYPVLKHAIDKYKKRLTRKFKNRLKLGTLR